MPDSHSPDLRTSGFPVIFKFGGLKKMLQFQPKSTSYFRETSLLKKLTFFWHVKLVFTETEVRDAYPDILEYF